MEEANKYLIMVIYMKAILKMDKKMDKAFILGKIKVFIEVFFSNKRSMEKRCFKWNRDLSRQQG